MMKEKRNRRGFAPDLRYLTMSWSQGPEARLPLLWDVEASIEGRTYRSALVISEPPM